MKTSLIRFITSDSLRLDGLLFEPEKQTQKCIIHVHGGASDFYRARYFDVFPQKITEAGHAFLTFNNRGACLKYTFNRENEKGELLDRAIIGAENEKFDESEIDIEAAITFAKSKGYNEIVLQGHSYGCNKVIWYVINNKFDGKINLLSPSDVMLYANAKNHKVPEIVDIFRYRDQVISPALKKIKNDLLVEIATNDKYIIQKNKQECINYIVKAFSKSKVTWHIIENVNHDFDGKHEEVASNITAWL